MRLIIIAAVAKNGVIGRNDKIPWGILSEMMVFRKITMGKPVLMGRRTAESVGPLKGRLNIVLTSSPENRISGFKSVKSDDDLGSLSLSEVYVAGGGQVYRHFLPMADEMIISHMRDEYDGDCHFPDVDWGEWRVVDLVAEHPLFVTKRYVRRGALFRICSYVAQCLAWRTR